jgi:nitrogen regulatory protein PII
MHLIRAIIRPDKVDQVKEGGTRRVPCVRPHSEGGARARSVEGHSIVYRGQEYSVSLLPKMSVESVVPGDLVETS